MKIDLTLKDAEILISLLRQKKYEIDQLKGTEEEYSSNYTEDIINLTREFRCAIYWEKLPDTDEDFY